MSAIRPDAMPIIWAERFAIAVADAAIMLLPVCGGNETGWADHRKISPPLIAVERG